MGRLLHRWRLYGAMALLLAVTLVIVACGGDDDAPAATTAPAAAEPTATTAAAAPAATTAPAAVATATPTKAAAAPAKAKEPVADRLKVTSLAPGNQVTMYFQTFQSSGGNLRTIYDHLIWMDRHTGAYAPMLATEWNVSNGAKDWQFILRDDVTFHNGYKFTADDVKASWNIIQTEPDLADSGHAIRDRVGADENIEVVSDTEVIFHLVQPWVQLPYAFGEEWVFTQYSGTHWDEVGEEGYIADPVGTGPFKFKEMVINEHWLVERYKNPGDDHWWKIPDFAELQLIYAPEEATRMAMLLAEEAYIADIPGELMDEAEEAGMLMQSSTLPGFQVFNIMGSQVGPEHEDYDATDPLKNVQVRKALDLAVDKMAIINAFFPGRAEPQAVYNFGSFRPPFKEEWTQHPFDAAEAKAILAAEGYDDDNPLEIRLLVGNNMSGVPEAPDVAEAMMQMYQEIGIVANVHETDYGSVASEIREHTLASTVVISRFSPWIVNLSWKGGFDGKGNWVICSDPYLVDLAEEYYEVTTQEEAWEYETLYGQYLYDNHVTIPIAWLKPAVAVNPKFVADYTANHLHFGPVRHHEFTEAVFK